VTTVDTGWGSGPWGVFPWAGLGPTDVPVSPALSNAFAIRENVVQLFFSLDLVVTGLLDSNDAGDPLHYVVTPDTSTIGYDGLPARTVGVIRVDLVDDQGLAGTILNLILDRPLSPYPALYDVTVHDLVGLSPANAHATFYGVRQPFRDPTPDGLLPSRDIAHPDTLSSALDPLPNGTDPLVLGTIPVDSSGDYAFDEGIASLRKRVFRRMLSIPGSFLHLGNAYGVGTASFLKLLASPANRQKIATAAEAQIRQEPDVSRVKVKIQYDPATPQLARYVVLVKPVVGAAKRFDVPVVIVAG
jgi:hypothetical protein